MVHVRTCCLLAIALLSGREGVCQAVRPEGFPVTTQFSPVPSGKGWKGEEGPLSQEVLRDTIDNIRQHGFTGIETPTHRPAEEEKFILDYAQSKGMFVTAHAGALELFGRTEPPPVCVYSPDYAKAVRANAEKVLASLEKIPRLYNVFIYQDEPFHWGPKSFGYNPEVKTEFRKRYGYDLPPDLESVRDDRRKWGEVIDFRSSYFPDGWRQVYAIAKEINPNFKTVLTHDSHNTFGAGYSSHSEIAIDDIYHWGGDFSDMFVFDIYPYMMFDFRFGRPAQLPKPRISQTHYSFAEMRNLTQSYGKELGFWVGTYNPAWFGDYFCPELQAMAWSEREMSMTAAAAGADFLLTGYKIPADAGHWETFGDGLRLLQKAGERLVGVPKVKAKACMLFPRTQYIQLQQEYFNVGLSFELFLRAFGELDILHEDQVTDEKLSGYELLVLFDVELLPETTARRVAAFVVGGGTLIADCVPTFGADRQPMPVMEELFGVKDAKTGRVRRSGHWVPYKKRPPIWANRPADPPDESSFTTDVLKAETLGVALDLVLVSPRPATATSAQVLASTVSGQPAVVRRGVGRGQVFLLGFCLQDTYFKTWEDDNAAGRQQLRNLLAAITRAAGVTAHVASSNADIEASVRANGREGFLFVINHEATVPETTVSLADLPFPVGAVTDLESGQAVTFRPEGQNEIQLDFSVPLGEVRLCRLAPVAESSNEQGDAKAGPTFTLWQLPNQTRTQMMSYVIRSRGGKVIVIDGGNAGDAAYLAAFLKGLGSRVDAWFISHPHSDHFDALREIVKAPGGLQIQKVYASMPSQAWIDQFGSESEKASFAQFHQALAAAGHTITDLTLGQVFDIDGTGIEVLGVKNPEITANAVNNSSLVLRVSDGVKSVLFLGDLGAEGGEKLLRSPAADRLPSDYVQMAHHG
ncbi:MAG: MBL fold metallo-hydrolase, partial [Thermoguttaceae bacterium]